MSPVERSPPTVQVANPAVASFGFRSKSAGSVGLFSLCQESYIVLMTLQSSGFTGLM